MIDFIENHDYLVSLVAFWMFYYIIGALIFLKHFKYILLSGVLTFPQCLYGIFLVPVYWNPERIMFLGISLEDLLFTFFMGGLVWMGIAGLYRNRISYNYSFKTLIRRFQICSFFGFVVVAFLLALNIHSMINPFIAMVLWIVTVIIFKREYWRITLMGSFAFLAVYSFGFKIQLLIWPQFTELWTWKNMWGISVSGIPLEELVWAFLYGGSWGTAVAYFFDIKITDPEKNPVADMCPRPENTSVLE